MISIKELVNEATWEQLLELSVHFAKKDFEIVKDLATDEVIKDFEEFLENPKNFSHKKAQKIINTMCFGITSCHSKKKICAMATCTASLISALRETNFVKRKVCQWLELIEELEDKEKYLKEVEEFLLNQER